MASGVAAVVLAGGMGTRLRSKLVKVLHPVCGRPMVEHVIEACRGAGAGRIVVVVGHQADAVRRRVIGPGVETALQDPPLGTGHAVQVAAERLAGFTGSVLVVHGDTPLVRAETLQGLLQEHHKTGASATLLTAELDNPQGYGRVVREKEAVHRIVEQKDATDDELAIKEINTGTYCFLAAPLFGALRGLRPNNVQGEYYLTDVVEILALSGGQVRAKKTDDAGEALGINDRVQLAEAAAVMQDRIRRELMLSGVTLLDPASTVIDASVRIGADSTVRPFCTLEGSTVIGEGCTVGPHVRVADAIIEDGATVHMSVVLRSRIGRGTVVGPFAHVVDGRRGTDEVRGSLEPRERKD